MVVHHRQGLAELLGRGRVVVQELLGHAHAADVDGDDSVGRAVCAGTDRELGRATADVDDEERAAAEQLGLGPHDLGGGFEEDPAVGRVARSRRRGHTNPLDSVTVERGAILAQHGERELDGLGGELAGGVDAPAEAGDAHVALDGGRAARCACSAGLGHQQARRVRAAVDGAEKPAHDSRRSATHRPTGSSPPARCQA